VFALLALFASGCGTSDERAEHPRTSAPDPRVMRAGARVFAEQCQTCHPLLAKPNTEVHTDAPPLDLDEVKPSRAYVRAMVAYGKVAMGGFSGVIDDAELRAVVTYVTEVAGSDVTVPTDTTAAELTAGRRVYDERCQACHELGGRPPTDPNPIWMATDFDDVRPSVLYTERMVREGQREAMPSFRGRLTPEEIRAVALYVNARAR
jgi:mono/diheme cytochrome c family protein